MLTKKKQTKKQAENEFVNKNSHEFVKICVWGGTRLLRNALNCFQWFSSGCVNMNYFVICSFQIFHKGHAFLVMRGNYKNEGSEEGRERGSLSQGCCLWLQSVRWCPAKEPVTARIQPTWCRPIPPPPQRGAPFPNPQ